MAESKRPIGSDLAKVDAYVNTAADYEDLPEMTSDDFARGVLHVDGVPVVEKRGRGRPALANAKRPVTLRVEPDVLAAYKATGAGWQTRMAAVLREGLAKAKASR